MCWLLKRLIASHLVVVVLYHLCMFVWLQRLIASPLVVVALYHLYMFVWLQRLIASPLVVVAGEAHMTQSILTIPPHQVLMYDTRRQDLDHSSSRPLPPGRTYSVGICLSYKYFLVVIFAQRPRRRLTLTQI